MKFNLKLHSNVLGNTQQEPYFSTFCKVGTNHVNILVSSFFTPILGFLGDLSVFCKVGTTKNLFVGERLFCSIKNQGGGIAIRDRLFSREKVYHTGLPIRQPLLDSS